MKTAAITDPAEYEFRFFLLVPINKRDSKSSHFHTMKSNWDDEQSLTHCATSHQSYIIVRNH